ncbi:MAG TPA: hypothetical protein VKT83_14255 [bacterium]|nr:hypothetical protein [bacterium]
MKSFRKAFGFVLAAALVAGGAGFAAKPAMLPVEHDRSTALIVEHDHNNALIVEHDRSMALIVEHDHNNA